MNGFSKFVALGVVGTMVFAPAVAQAAAVVVTVTVENLAASNSVSFAPIGFAFHDGDYDAFDAGSAASASIRTMAELGSPAAWRADFMAAEPGAVVGGTGGPLHPGMTMNPGNFVVDTTSNNFFSFVSMVIPSNDHFIGNDDPTMFSLFDAGGNLTVSEITLTANRIWDAGSEVFDPGAAPFIAGANPALNTPEGGVVSFDFAGLSGYDGQTTGAGNVFDSQLTASTPVYRISFSTSAVPEPATWAMMIGGFALAGASLRQRRRNAPAAAYAA